MLLRISAAAVAGRIVEFVFMLLPRRRPSRRALERCKIVSHRGEYDNRRRRENTMAAFDAAAAAGVWGIEFDVRWSRDLCPVVIHDPTTGRVFDLDVAVAGLDLDDLHRRLPEIPTLAEVVETYGGRLHLMVELKPDGLGRPDLKAQRLADIFAGLQAGRDYHFLALQAESLQPAGFAGPRASVLVAEFNTAAQSRQVEERRLGGLCGHFLLLGERLLTSHRARGQRLGTGFPGSRYSFYRELNRGVDWIFTNRASKLAAIRERLLQR